MLNDLVTKKTIIWLDKHQMFVGAKSGEWAKGICKAKDMKKRYNII